MTSSQPELFPSLVERAMRTAAMAHRDQTRKASALPYIAHPASVAMILVRAGFDEPHVLAAALLHDVVEDTDVTLADLARDYPPEVIDIVAALSEEKTDADGNKRPWKERKVDHIAVIASAPIAAQAVALADKLHNLTSTLVDLLVVGIAVWDRFNAARDEFLWYHDAMIEATTDADPRIETLKAACRDVLSQLGRLDEPNV